MTTRSKRKSSLRERQRQFIFRQKSRFEPVSRNDFCDIAQVLQMLEPTIDYLKYFREYAKLGVEPYSGIILYGPPGTGKTYTARLLATETKARYVYVRDFPRSPDEDTFIQEDIRVLFSKAHRYAKKTYRPVILFWAQFDSFLENAGKEALNQLYVELDGLRGNKQGVFVVAATAHDLKAEGSSEIFDQQLLRKGRLGIQIQFTHPTKRQQARLFQHYFKKKLHGHIDVKPLVHLIPDLTPAVIRDFVEEVYLRACRRRRLTPKLQLGPIKITKQDILATIANTLQGCMVAIDLPPLEKEKMALHELGHAAVAWELGRPVQMISLLPAADSLGKTISALSWEHQENEQDIKDGLATTLGGYAAEELFGFSTGHGRDADLKQATEVAKEYLAHTGSGHLIFKHYGPMAINNTKEFSVSQVQLNILEVNAGMLLRQQYLRALRILKHFGKERLRYIANAILKKDPPIILQQDLDKLRQESHKESD
ncbi:MAG: AAA family ATPase [bacterium]|nr:AAA family ATPase [bacterium]